MIPMRRCTSVAVMAAAPRAAGTGRCVAAGPGSTASSTARRYRIAKSLEMGEGKLTRPTVGNYGRARSPRLSRSRLASFELGFAPRLLLRRLTLLLGPRLSARSLFRGRPALRLRRPSGLLGPVAPLRTGLVPLIGLIGPGAMIGLIRPGSRIGLIGPGPMIRLVRLVAMIGLVGPPAVATIVVPMVFRARATLRWPNI